MRTSSKSVVAALTTAAVLVVGIDVVAFAASGDSLLLGRVNQADKLTVVKRSDPGPVLRLRTASEGGVPFSTNGTGKVRNLNADRVDGRQASALATHAVTFRAGRRGQGVSPAGLWSTPVPPGLYEISFDAMLWDQDAQTPANFICGVLDISTFGTENQVIYAASSAMYTGGSPAAVSGSAVVRLRHGASPGAVCFPESGQFQFFKPLRVSFTRINSRDVRVAEPLEQQGRVREANPFGSGS